MKTHYYLLFLSLFVLSCSSEDSAPEATEIGDWALDLVSWNQTVARQGFPPISLNAESFGTGTLSIHDDNTGRAELTCTCFRVEDISFEFSWDKGAGSALKINGPVHEWSTILISANELRVFWTESYEGNLEDGVIPTITKDYEMLFSKQ